MQKGPDAFFRPDKQGGQRLFLHHSPPLGTQVRGVLLYVHPWAEEMNKSRRMAAITSRALAAEGYAVLQIDLLGCGDSSGEFAEARWERWLLDLQDAAQWLQSRHSGAPLWLWGLRVGALLAAALAARLADAQGATPNLLFWQPTQQGKTAWQQFLRLKAAAQLADGGGKSIMNQARAELAAGRSIDVAGYTVAPELAQEMEASNLDALTGAVEGLSSRMVWLEVSNQPELVASPATVKTISLCKACGWITLLKVVSGPSFWQSTEIEDAPALVDATLRALAP